MTLFTFVNQLRPQTGHPRYWEVMNHFFLEITSATMSSDANTSSFVTITLQTGIKVGHGTRKKLATARNRATRIGGSSK